MAEVITIDSLDSDDVILPFKKRQRTESPAPFEETGFKSLAGFQLIRVLRDLPDTKSCFLLASHEASGQDAVVILEQEPFGEEKAREVLNDHTTLENILKNDVYATYKGNPSKNAIKVTVIHPATEKHIDKYSAKQCCLITETYQMYSDIVEPFLKQNSFSHKWVYNILNHETESERILFEDLNPDQGFLLIPDMKWSGNDPASLLYVLALAFRKDVKSLRDLKTEHLPLLKNIKEKTLNTIEEKFKLKRSSVRAYIHYQPSYYHFHIHFNLLGNNVPGTQSERAHMLDTVISNIENYPDYYQKVSLVYSLQDDSELYKEIKSKYLEK